MQFQNFEAEDFLQEKSFLQYCLGGNNPDVAFWENWIAENPEKAEAVAQAREMYYLLNGNLTPGRFLVDERRFREALQANSDHADAGKPVRKMKPWLTVAAAVAAVAVLFVSVKLLWPAEPAMPGETPAPVVYSSGSAEKKYVQLPDGSMVMLNSETSLSLSPGFNAGNREVFLQGEGYFNVTHNSDRPFIVRTEAMDVRVLGTVFNVKAYETDENAETALVSGSVQVDTKRYSEKLVQLEPNEKLVVTANDIEVVKLVLDEDANVPEEISWTKERLVFRNDDFSDIASILERWYGVKISFSSDELKSYRFTGHFEKKSLEQVLRALSLSRPFNFEVNENGHIRIVKK